ncbi:MAG: rRNA maturation RNase YbeY, partial [Acidimicrobiales bacterium]
FLGKDGPTDVLAFPIDEEPAESGRSPDSGGSGPGFTGELEEVPTLLGDVVICPAVAHRNAPEHAGTYEDELALLVVHGVLHLLGMDHLDDDEAEEMERRERELLARHHGPMASPRFQPAAGVTAAAETATDAGGAGPAAGDAATPAPGVTAAPDSGDAPGAAHGPAAGDAAPPADDPTQGPHPGL